jgi:TPR repeat protein
MRRGNACFNIGVCYFNGRGVDPDVERARSLLLDKACAGVDRQACTALADLHAAGSRRRPR